MLVRFMYDAATVRDAVVDFDDNEARCFWGLPCIEYAGSVWSWVDTFREHTGKVFRVYQRLNILKVEQ